MVQTFKELGSRRSARRGSSNARRILIVVVGMGVTAVAAAPSSATFPGTNGRISFVAFVERTESGEIFSAKPDGSNVRKLTKSGRDRFSVLSDWSPDGQTIAFDSDRVDLAGRRGVNQVYLMNADGSGLVQLTRGPGFHGAPGWSPDATQLAIEADWGSEPALAGIWLIPASDPDGVTQDEATRVTTVPRGAFDSEPQFSPDGSMIVFTRFRTARRSAIHRVNADGAGLKRLTPWRLNASDPDWSPGGRRIAFDSGDAAEPGSQGNIYVMRADGSGRKRLTDHPPIGPGGAWNFANNPVWSPSGKQIMYTRFLPNRGLIKAMRPDGSDKRVVLQRPGFPTWVDWGTHP